MKKIFLLTLLSCFMYGENLKINVTKEEMGRILADGIRTKLPIEVDKIAEITNINSVNKMIINTIEINSNEEPKIKKLIKTNEGTQEIIEGYYKGRANVLCNHERVRMLISNKVIFAEELIDKTTKRSLGYYTIEEEDCLKLGIERKMPSL